MADPRAVLDVIRQRADNATDGPWTAVRIYHRPESHYADDHWCWQVGPQGDPEDDDEESFVDCIREDELDASDLAEFIAASRTDVPRLVAALTAALDVHTRGSVIPGGGFTGIVPTEDDRIDDACEECETAWPCPTVRVIEAALTGEGG